MSLPSSFRGRTFQPLPPGEERELVARLRRGDESALDGILSAYWHGLVAFAFRILSDHDRAKDVVQESFIRLWERRSEWERTDTLRPILYRIVRNLALNEQRRLSVARKWAHRLRRPRRDPSPSPLAELEAGDLRAFVRRAIDSLPERRREIFLLVRYHQHSYREASVVLGVSPQTIANQMTLAMKDLRVLLEPRAAELETVTDLSFPDIRTG